MSDTPSTPALLLQNGYQYLEQIGEGSNGKTYRALNLKTGEPVTIKALKFSDSLKNYELFAREAKILRSLRIPGTPRYYEYITGVKEFTECWIVQEYIPGENLLEKMEKGEIFDEIQTLKILLQLADIIRMLQLLYSPPIIHRDIKPSNILVRDTPKDGMTLVLIDFGAVANPQRRGCNSTVAGTIGYMAPEQLIGDCSLQSDYYSLGATALHLLTRIPPSEFKSDGFKLKFEEKLKATVPGIHKETIALLQKLMAPEALHRPQTSNELLFLISETLKKVDDPTLVRSEIEKKIEVVKTLYPSYRNHKYTCIFINLIWVFFSLVILFICQDAVNIPIYLACAIILPVLFFNLIIPTTLLKGLNHKLKQLPDCSSTLEYLPSNISDAPTANQEAIGTIQGVFGDVAEFTVTIDHRCLAAFCRNDSHQYSIGDKIRVQYTRVRNGYTLCAIGLA